MINYRDLYDRGVELLQKQSIAEAKLDARLLLENICGTDRNTLLAHGDRPVSEDEEQRYLLDIQKRASHVPLQHITGNQEFMGLTFSVNENVLIPRQDTEILVEEALIELQDQMHILDLCTGSGCILLSLLHYSNDCVGVGVDLSAEALQVANQNAEKLHITNACFVQSNLFQDLQIEEKFDMLVSNPPYIPTKVVDELMEEVRDHEPRMALDGEEDGLAFYRRISREAKPYLKRGAFVYLEIGHDQGDAVSRIMEEEGYREIRVKQDYVGLDRVVCCEF